MHHYKSVSHAPGRWVAPLQRPGLPHSRCLVGAGVTIAFRNFNFRTNTFRDVTLSLRFRIQRSECFECFG